MEAEERILSQVADRGPEGPCKALVDESDKI